MVGFLTGFAKGFADEVQRDQAVAEANKQKMFERAFQSFETDKKLRAARMAAGVTSFNKRKVARATTLERVKAVKGTFGVNDAEAVRLVNAHSSQKDTNEVIKAIAESQGVDPANRPLRIGTLEAEADELLGRLEEPALAPSPTMQFITDKRGTFQRVLDPLGLPTEEEVTAFRSAIGAGEPVPAPTIGDRGVPTPAPTSSTGIVAAEQLPTPTPRKQLTPTQTTQIASAVKGVTDFEIRNVDPISGLELNATQKDNGRRLNSILAGVASDHASMSGKSTADAISSFETMANYTDQMGFFRNALIVPETAISLKEKQENYRNQINEVRQSQGYLSNKEIQELPPKERAEAIRTIEDIWSPLVQEQVALSLDSTLLPHGNATPYKKYWSEQISQGYMPLDRVVEMFEREVSERGASISTLPPAIRDREEARLKIAIGRILPRSVIDEVVKREIKPTPVEDRLETPDALTEQILDTAELQPELVPAPVIREEVLADSLKTARDSLGDLLSDENNVEDVTNILGENAPTFISEVDSLDPESQILISKLLASKPSRVEKTLDIANFANTFSTSTGQVDSSGIRERLQASQDSKETVQRIEGLAGKPFSFAYRQATAALIDTVGRLRAVTGKLGDAILSGDGNRVVDILLANEPSSFFDEEEADRMIEIAKIYLFDSFPDRAIDESQVPTIPEE